MRRVRAALARRRVCSRVHGWASAARGGLAAAALAAAVLLAGCAHGLRPPPGGPIVPAPGAAPLATNANGVPLLRIGLATGLDSVRIGCDRTWRISLRGKVRRPNRNAGGTSWLFFADKGRVGVIDNLGRYRGAFAETLRFYPDGGGNVTALGSVYRDTIEVFAGSDRRLTAVNVIDVEDYLRGVVAQEIGEGGDGGIEAVKAQAVAARTYALSYIGRWSDLGFDIYGDTRDQAYLGIAGERPASDRAIEATRGVVAFYRGAYIRANYFSTCGGHTASNDEVWDQDPLPYLRGRSDQGRDGDFCQDSKQYRWTESMSGDEFWKDFCAFRLAGADEGAERLRDVRVKSRSESGRVRELDVKTSKRTIVVKGDAIRWAVRRPIAGNPPLRSTLFDVETRKKNGRVQSVVIKGRGYGHGVGMCQTGALGMARKGYSYDAILRHYYKGIDLDRLY